MNSDDDHETLLRRWWEEHRGIFHKIARSFAPAAADEADLLQEMMVQLWRSLAGYRSACRPSTWIYRVCFNTALSWKRGESRRLRSFMTMAAPPEVAYDDSPDVRTEHAERLSTLYEAIRRLPPAERSLVVMQLDGLSYQEIAEVTGLTENHVGVSLTRARKKLMKLLERRRDEF